MNEQVKAPRFIVGDETSHDTTTDLTWTKEDAVDRGITFDEAQPIADEFNAKAFGGFTDWRVPEFDALSTIVDRKKFNPAIGTDAFPNCKSDGYWSSTVDAEDPDDYAWVQDFYNGYSYIHGRGCRFRLRLVRGPARQ